MSLPEAIDTVLDYIEEWEAGLCPSCGCQEGEGIGHIEACELREAMDLLEYTAPSLNEEFLSVVEAFSEVPRHETLELADHLGDATSPGVRSEAQEKAVQALAAFLRTLA